MSWMLTATGVQFDLRFIAADTISLLDIAHHLAQINRYTGACRRPFSVAEHSLLVCELVQHQYGERDPAVLMAALMHDAHEAYTTDLSSPMKRVIGEAWRQEEDRIAHHVRKRFNLLAAFASGGARIHWADMTALSTERAQLLPPTGDEWQANRTHPPCTWWNLKEREAFSWIDWRQAFLDKFAELQFARAERANELMGDAASTLNETTP